MWIAKPIRSLSNHEVALWQKIECQVPLSQTLDWARATETLSARSFLIFSPEEKVGGVVFTLNGHQYECINGPFLDWDQPNSAPRQLATFAMAVSKLNSSFQSLTLKPRWSPGDLERRQIWLPVETSSRSTAATWKVPIQKTAEDQFELLTPRMRRTLKNGRAHQIQTHWEKLSYLSLSQFVPKMTQFAKSHQFMVPDISWFKTLMLEGPQSSIQYWVVTAVKTENEKPVSIAQILVCFFLDEAHYLFGYEERDSSLKSSISTSAAAHWEVLNHCTQAGIKNYDLNGYLIDASQDHPYYGVCRFKEQFSGYPVHYDIPEFLIR